MKKIFPFNLIKKITGSWIFLIIFFSIILYFPNLFSYFHSDDWFYLRIVSISEVSDILNFFLPDTYQSIGVFRPLSAQITFYLLYHLFALESKYYYLFATFLFVATIYFLYQIVKKFYDKKNLPELTVFYYAFSANHFTRMYFLSAAYQEYLMTLFSLLSIYTFFKKHYSLTLVFFLFALLSKETAVIIPIIIFLLLIFHEKKKILTSLKHLKWHLFILIIFLIYRLFYGISEQYTQPSGLNELINHTGWYATRSLGFPENLDFYGETTIINKDFFLTLTTSNWNFIIIGFVFIISIFVYSSWLFSQNKKKYDIYKNISLFGLMIFLLGITPVLFFVRSLFALEINLSLIGMVLFLASISVSLSTKNKISIILLYLIFNIYSLQTMTQNNQIIWRAKSGKKLIDYLNKNKVKEKNINLIIEDSNYPLEYTNSVEKFKDEVIWNNNIFIPVYKNPAPPIYYTYQSKASNPTELNNSLIINVNDFIY